MNPLNAYKTASVNTASPGKLLIMLFDGLLRFMDQASEAVTNGDIEAAHRSLVRSQDIVMELKATLDHDKAPDLCENLDAVYTFIYTKLVDANRLKDVVHLEDVRPMIADLRDAFAEAERQFTMEGRI